MGKNYSQLSIEERTIFGTAKRSPNFAASASATKGVRFESKLKHHPQRPLLRASFFIAATSRLA
jgi:hypothetical protein